MVIPLCSLLLRPHVENYVQFRLAVQEKEELTGAVQQGETWLENCSIGKLRQCKEKLRALWLFMLDKLRLREDLTAVCHYL